MLKSFILAEEALLLALHDEKGTQEGSFVALILAGAALAEFALDGRVEAIGEGKKLMFRPVAQDAPTHPYLAEIWKAMSSKKGFDRKPSALITSASNTKGAVRMLKDGLVDRGILDRVQRKVLFLFPHTVYPLKDAGAEAAINERLSRVMFHGHPPTERDSVLIALIKHAGLLRRNFDKDLLKEHKDRIAAVAEGAGAAGEATKSAIEAVQAAIMAAVIAGSVASTAASG